MNKIHAVLLSVFISACATVGREVSSAQIATLKKGETTVDQAVSTLGAPTGITKMSDGRQILTYSFAHAQARPASFIPVVGLLAGGADVRSSALLLTFDAQGVLQDYTSHQSSTGAGTGLAAGAYTKPDMTQPQEANKN